MPDPATQPLFGETRRQDKIVNAVVAIVTALFVTITVFLSIVNSLFKHDKCLLTDGKTEHFCVYFMDIVFAVVILLLLIPQVFVVTWYRRGELEPKFRRMIYYNAVVTILLCITAILYFFNVGTYINEKNHCHHNVSKLTKL